MSTIGADIRLKAPSATRALVLAALLTAALGAGVLIGRATVSTLAPARTATIETVIPTRWLDQAPAVRGEVMQKMNAVDGSILWLDTTSTGRLVMEHANGIAAWTLPAPGSVGLRVMQYMNEVATS
jgi:hypothetical protein